MGRERRDVRGPQVVKKSTKSFLENPASRNKESNVPLGIS
jgi:hypothetical protein